jgi:hypothetical protein
MAPNFSKANDLILVYNSLVQSIHAHCGVFPGTSTAIENSGTEIFTMFKVRHACSLFFLLLFYYSYMHTRLGSFLPPAPTHSLTTLSVPSLSPQPMLISVGEMGLL